MLYRVLLTITLLSLIAAGSAAAAERTRAIVAYDDVRIDLIAEGAGPLVVLLPSRGRGSLDCDQFAAVTDAPVSWIRKLAPKS